MAWSTLLMVNLRGHKNIYDVNIVINHGVEIYDINIVINNAIHIYEKKMH